MTRKIAYLLNPISGTGKRQGLEDIIIAATEKQGIPFEILTTDPTGRYDALKLRLQHGAFTDVVAAGGDGTISAVTNALRDTGVRFGIIPLGSGNGLALAAGISKQIPSALATIFKGNASLVDGFMINNRFSCMLSGIGFDAKVAHAFARQKKRGLWTYVKVAARHFFSADPYPFTINTIRNKIHSEAYFISVANANQFGNQFTIAPKARLNDGLIDVVIVQRMNKLQLLLAIAHQLRFGDIKEKMFNHNNIIYFQTDQMHIENPALAPLHIDGDPAETSNQFEIRVVHNAFLLIQP